MNIGTFNDFFREMHGYDPYDWQTRMCQQVLKTGWSDFIQLPTGSGKTSVLDIAVFALAAQADRPAVERTTGTRIFFVIDRRIVVDEADRCARQLASHLRSSLQSSDCPATKSVAENLLAIAKSDGRIETSQMPIDPLAVHTLRGGFYRTNDWASSLVQPTIVTSTVDQVGSRMLFRGYGISPTARPLQAALVATDSLLILDEAHTATAMGDTIQTVRKHQTHAQKGSPIVRPMIAVQMTATLPESVEESGDNVFKLNKTDLADSESPLAKRYETKKTIKLDVAKSAKGKTAIPKLAKDLVDRTKRHLNDDIGSIAVVVNRIKTARLIHSTLSDLLAKKKIDIELHLMIGQMRPIDRDVTGGRLRQVLGTSSESSEDQKPVVVVTTQCLEVGADLDFDRMISEAASIDALRQRFGRLNRGGRPIQCEGEIVIRADQMLTDAQVKKLKRDHDADPVYGTALTKTYQWLESISTDGAVDFGSAKMDEHWRRLRTKTDDASKYTSNELLIDQPQKTTLLPAHVDLLSQTYEFFVPKDDAKNGWDRIAVHPDPDVGVFLHGQQRRDTNVQVCWRADVCGAELKNDKWAIWSTGEDKRLVTVTEAPPTSPECMSVSIKTITEFLVDLEADDESADVPSTLDDDRKPRKTDIPSNRRPVIWRGPDDSIVCNDSRQIRPGDTLVLPVSAGGWSILGHIPGEAVDPCVVGNDEFPKDQVINLAKIDVADEAYLRASWKPRLRLHPLLKTLGIDSTELQKSATENEPSESEIIDAYSKLQSSFEGTLSAVVTHWIDEETPAKPRRRSHAGLILHGKKTLTRDEIAGLLTVDTDSRTSTSDFESGFSDQTSTSSNVMIELADHLCRVRERAGAIAKSVAVDSLTDDISLAGELHDIGKADGRFQSMLVGGSPNEAWLRRKLLAKSKQVSRSKSERIRDRERSTLPDRFRHELLSAQLVSKANLSESDLVNHLVASHHGHARPWMPPSTDRDPTKVELGPIGIAYVCEAEDRSDAFDTEIRLAIAERFWRLQGEYGAWGLAYLESILRLADQQISREEASGAHAPPESSNLGVSYSSGTNVAAPNKTVLTGIDGDSPLGMLASLGALRVINHAIDEPVKLHWRVSDGAWRPVLTSMAAIDEKQIENILSDHLGQDTAQALLEFDELDVTDSKAGKLISCPQRFRCVTRKFLNAYLDSGDSRLNCDIAAALGNECTQKLSAKEPAVEHTELYMTKGSGHQRMLDLMRVIRAQTTWDHIERSLYGVWDYVDEGRGRILRWDPAEDRSYAKRWKNPSSDAVMTMLGANYLAIEAVSFFPTAIVNRRLATTGFDRMKRKTYLSWPIWTTPLTSESIKALLQLSEIHTADPNDLWLSQLSVSVVKRVERIRDGKYFNFSYADSV